MLLKGKICVCVQSWQIRIITPFWFFLGIWTIKPSKNKPGGKMRKRFWREENKIKCHRSLGAYTRPRHFYFFYCVCSRAKSGRTVLWSCLLHADCILGLFVSCKDWEALPPPPPTNLPQKTVKQNLNTKARRTVFSTFEMTCICASPNAKNWSVSVNPIRIRIVFASMLLHKVMSSQKTWKI